MTAKPIIELKSIKVHTGLSEETPAYTAKLFVDGKHFADVSNQGHGGCDLVYAPNGIQAGFADRISTLEAQIAATYPKHSCGDGYPPMDECLEILCHNAAWTFVEQRNMKSRLSRTVMTFEDGKVYTWKGKKTEERMNAVAAKKPDAIILNRLAFAEAWTLIQDAA
ncbi:MAG: hypothetical protein V3S55_15355 [Nitrospiraceae bacterium]